MPKHEASLKLGAAGVALIAATLASREAQAGSARLLVFLHVAVKQRALQGQFQNALPGVDVTAVGRIGDFERSLKEGADTVMALPIVLSAYKLTPTLRGMRGGSSEEKYSLVAVGSAPDPATVTSVGALDVLGRGGTTSFVHMMVGSSPRVERVPKVEDLLPLLQMQRVAAVMIPSRLFSEISSASKLPLAQSSLSKVSGLPAVASITGTGAQVVAAIKKMPLALSKTLGVDAWD
ncbi:MAG TPA: hypothetical protein VKP30_24715 [Polyangiaceae bacterium]|nr:hypothetical protein [Polyangiaceae bacterium]